VVQFDTGRTRQKMRTRRELLGAARRLIERNVPVTVEAVAAEADISRTTAYRYFADAEAMILEAFIDGQAASAEEIVGDSLDVRERVHRVLRYLTGLVREAETAYRTYLSRTLAGSVRPGAAGRESQRAGRRVPIYEHALAPVRSTLSEEDFRFLVLSLSAVSGVESQIALKDVCRVDEETADRIAASIVDAILDRHLGPGVGAV
jgi:AcrR family transcriptional regulator